MIREVYRRNKPKKSDIIKKPNPVNIIEELPKSLSCYEKLNIKFPFLKKIDSIMESATYQIIMTVLTLFILFADDIKILTTDAPADPAFSIIFIILMVIFFIEIIFSSFAIEDYFLGFFFWLDLASVLSTLLDVHWFYTFFIHKVSGSKKKAKTFTSIIKAGKSAKLASRAVRVLRVLRIIRLVRVSKLYKAKEQILQIEERKLYEQGIKESNEYDEENENDEDNKNYSDREEDELSNTERTLGEKDNNDNAVNNHDNDKSDIKESTESKNPHEIDEIPQESKIGKNLSELTTKKVIIIILVLLIGIILFNSSFYFDTYSSMDFGMEVFHNFKSFNDPILNMTFNLYIEEHTGTTNPLIFIRVGQLTFGDESLANNIRETSKGIYSTNCDHLFPYDLNNSLCYSIFDQRSSSKLASLLNIIKTIFIGFSLAIGSYCFNLDITELVLEPLESMIKKVDQISKSPINAMIQTEKEEIEKMLNDERIEDIGCYCNGEKEGNNQKKKGKEILETLLLQNAISRIGILLALSFGEAGGEIVSKNMQKGNTGDINPFLPGKQMFATFCYCKIQKCSEITEVLEEKSMIFLNEIAEIIHEICSEYCGNVMRNFGDSFLIVWKYNKEYLYKDIEMRKKLRRNKTIPEDEQAFAFNCVYLDNCPQVTQLTDLILICYIKIVEEICNSKKLDEYRGNGRLHKYFKGFELKINVSIDLGWAIEAPIGTPYKIDTNYLSPYVNRVYNLEKKCNSYGVNIIMSDTFVEKLSSQAQNHLRMIDIIKENAKENEGIKKEVGLYTIDLDSEYLKDERFSINEHIFTRKNEKTFKKIAKFRKRMNREKNYQLANAKMVDVWLWEEFEKNDDDFYILRKSFVEDKEFNFLFNYAVDEYLFGDWNVAKLYFTKLLKRRENDGPCNYIYNQMKKYNFIKPEE